MADLVNSLLAAYDLVPPIMLFPLPNSGVNNRTLGVRTGVGDLVWKAYATSSDPANIEYEHALLAWLDASNLSFHVPVPRRARSGETVSATAQGWQALFVRLPGTAPQPCNLDHIEAVGAALGELHTTLRRYPTDARPGVPPLGDLHRIHPRVPDPFSLKPGHLALPDAPPYDTLFSWWRSEVSFLRPFAEGAYRRLPWQVIHGDFLPANTLFDGDRLSAVVDFEFAHPDARALDVASGLNFIMRVWENPEPWEATQRFCHGYGRWIRLAETEAEAIPWLVRLRDAGSTLWWIGRGLAAGDVRPALERMQIRQRPTRWLAEHGQRLVDMVGQEAGQ